MTASQSGLSIIVSHKPPAQGAIKLVLLGKLDNKEQKPLYDLLTSWQLLINTEIFKNQVELVLININILINRNIHLTFTTFEDESREKRKEI